MINDLRDWTYSGPHSLLKIANTAGMNHSTLTMAAKRGGDVWQVKATTLLDVARARDMLDGGAPASKPGAKPSQAKRRQEKEALKRAISAKRLECV